MRTAAAALSALAISNAEDHVMTLELDDVARLDGVSHFAAVAVIVTSSRTSPAA